MAFPAWFANSGSSLCLLVEAKQRHVATISIDPQPTSARWITVALVDKSCFCWSNLVQFPLIGSFTAPLCEKKNEPPQSRPQDPRHSTSRAFGGDLSPANWILTIDGKCIPMYHLCILIACYIPPFVPMMFLSGWQNRNLDINMLEHVGTTYFLAKYFFIVLFTHGLYRLYAYYKYLDHHSNETHGRFLVLPHFCWPNPYQIQWMFHDFSSLSQDFPENPMGISEFHLQFSPNFPRFPLSFHAFFRSLLVPAREPMGIKGSTASAQLRPPEMDWKSVKVEDLRVGLRPTSIVNQWYNHLKNIFV